MKSLPQIKHDNRMTNRDFGSMCQWSVFVDGDFVAQFINEDHAYEFASYLQFEDYNRTIDVVYATP